MPISRFLPAAALAIALAPYAAEARSSASPVQGPAQQLFLVGNFSGAQAEQAHGRAAAANAPAGLYAVDAAAQYAAIQSLPQEN